MSIPAQRPVAPVAPAPDNLGPLPPGWQMSKTDNERVFFIDHINKVTTWVSMHSNRGECDASSIAVHQKTDPRTGRPSSQSSAQQDGNKNGPLPVSDASVVLREL